MTYYIYKIVCEDSAVTDFYIGSTANFTVRKYQHKSNCNNEKNKNYNLKIYQTIRANGNWSNWRMVIIQVLECDKITAQIAEEKYRTELQATLNSQSAYTGLSKDEYISEWRQNNKHKMYKTMKEYYIKNKDQIHKKKNTNYNCECGGRYTNANKARHFDSDKHKNYLLKKMI